MQRHAGKQRVEKTRDPFEKIGDIKGTFHARIGTEIGVFLSFKTEMART